MGWSTAAPGRISFSLVLFVLAWLVPAVNAEATFPGNNGKIVFSSLATERQIYAMNPDGSGLTQLTTGPGVNGRPAWSPDGRKVAYQRAGYQVWVMNADGSGNAQVTNDAGQPMEDPAW